MSAQRGSCAVLRRRRLAFALAALATMVSCFGRHGARAWRRRARRRRCRAARLLRRHAALERDRLLERGGRLLDPLRQPRSRRPRAAGRPIAVRCGPITARVAMVMPVHNEDPARVIRHLEETVASLDATARRRRSRSSCSATRRIRRSRRRRRQRSRAGAPGRAGPSRLHYRRRRDNRRAQDRQSLGVPGAARAALRSHGRARCRQRDVGCRDLAAGPGHGGPSRDRHPAAADRGPAEPQPVPAHLPVRHAPRHARLHGRQRLVAGRLRSLLGPQRA